MNILGVGGWELVLILLIMLIVAGPKRMARWAFIMGQYVAKFRAMWAETVDVLQKEFDDAGVGIQIPKEPPTRGSINKQASKVLNEFTRPVKESLDKAAAEMGEIKKTTAAATQVANNKLSTGNGAKPTAPKPKPADQSKGEFGTWSGGTAPSSGSADEFGTWSGKQGE